MSLRNFRERVNLMLYDSKDRVLTTIRALNIIVSLGALGVLLIYFGFPHTPTEQDVLLGIIEGCFGFYVLSFFTRLFYDFHPRTFLKKNWFEGIIVALLLVEGIAQVLFGELVLQNVFRSFGVKGVVDFEAAFIQLYFILVLITEVTRKSSGFRPKIRMHPSAIFMLSFAVLIFGGTGLLMLPEMTTQNGSMNFLDAFFMSTSATCVTGLATVDVAHAFSFKGHVVILFLIKLGGLNIIAFGSFMALAGKLGMRVKHSEMVEDFLNRDNVLSAKGMLGKIIIWSTLIELAGAVVMFFSWKPNVPQLENFGDKVFSSLFHAVSAFNNAGLSLFENGLYNEYIQDNYAVHLNVTILVFFGALGFVAIFDIFDFRNIRERIKKPWKTISFSTKIAWYFSIALVVIGVIGFYFLEQDNTLEGEGFFASLSHSLFQSVTRTSGFNTVDIGAMSVPMLVLMCFLMFVGSSSSSTGGGIKTSTFSILWSSVWATIKGRKHAQLFNRTISNDLIMKALGVLLFFIAGNLICIFALSITEAHILAETDRNVMDLIFEEVSAFGTVGLSTGITPQLSDAGKLIIIISMFVGRVGTLTFAYLFGKQVLSKDYKYPDGHTMVG